MTYRYYVSAEQLDLGLCCINDDEVGRIFFLKINKKIGNDYIPVWTNIEVVDPSYKYVGNTAF